MKRGALAVVVGIIGLVVGLLIGRVAVAPGGAGGGPPTMTHVPKPRGFLVVLVEVDNQCIPVKLGGHRAQRNDHVTWDIRDYCDAQGQTIEIKWTGSNGSPTTRALKDSINASGKLLLKADMDNVPDNPEQEPNRVLDYPYDIVIDGNAFTDPKLEIDPF